MAVYLQEIKYLDKIFVNINVMEFILKTVFDIQAGKKYDIVTLLDKCLSLFFSERTYSPMVEEINIDLYCFKTPFRLKHLSRPVYYEDKISKILPRDKKCDATFRMYHLLFVDIPLPDEFATCSEEDAVPMIGETMVRYFTDVALPVKIRKSFDKERFISDLQLFFTNYEKSR